MNASSSTTSLKLVLPVSILNLAVYLSAIIPVVISGHVVGNMLSFPDLGLRRSSRYLPVVPQGWRTWSVGQDCILSPNLHYFSVHEGEGVQDFHPFICKHFDLHHDGDTDGSDEMFSFVPSSIKNLWLSCSGAPG